MCDYDITYRLKRGGGGARSRWGGGTMVRTGGSDGDGWLDLAKGFGNGGDDVFWEHGWECEDVCEGDGSVEPLTI